LLTHGNGREVEAGRCFAEWQACSRNSSSPAPTSRIAVPTTTLAASGPRPHRAMSF
jgi:hypothetical protein